MGAKNTLVNFHALFTKYKVFVVRPASINAMAAIAIYRDCRVFNLFLYYLFLEQLPCLNMLNAYTFVIFSRILRKNFLPACGLNLGLNLGNCGMFYAILHLQK